MSENSLLSAISGAGRSEQIDSQVEQATQGGRGMFAQLFKSELGKRLKHRAMGGDPVPFPGAVDTGPRLKMDSPMVLDAWSAAEQQLGAGGYKIEFDDAYSIIDQIVKRIPQP